jgi:hypothetical protein
MQLSLRSTKNTVLQTQWQNEVKDIQICKTQRWLLVHSLLLCVRTVRHCESGIACASGRRKSQAQRLRADMSHSGRAEAAILCHAMPCLVVPCWMPPPGFLTNYQYLASKCC